METPNNTRDIASLIQIFFASKDIPIDRCDALEVAAKIQGYRDLHENQEIAGTPPEAGSIPNDQIALFFSALALQVRNGMRLTCAIQNCEGILPEKLISHLVVRMEKGEVLSAALLSIGFPRFITAAIYCGEETGRLPNSLEEAAHFAAHVKASVSLAISHASAA